MNEQFNSLIGRALVDEGGIWLRNAMTFQRDCVHPFAPASRASYRVSSRPGGILFQVVLIKDLLPSRASWHGLLQDISQICESTILPGPVYLTFHEQHGTRVWCEAFLMEELLPREPEVAVRLMLNTLSRALQEVASQLEQNALEAAKSARSPAPQTALEQQVADLLDMLRTDPGDDD